jgi:predicted nucleic acid-binding protein
VAFTNLARYAGTAGVLVDTNVWIDFIDESSSWHQWAIEQLQSCSERYPLHVNIVIYSELLIPGPDVAALDAMLDIYATLRTQLPWATASLTATAYALYRRSGGTKRKPLPDFFIGAHAAVSNLSILTRDPKPYKSVPLAEAVNQEIAGQR